jgi:quercetin dioxygenase-like cupin family protein
MRVTAFRGTDGGVGAEVSTSPTWEPFEEYDGKPLHRVRLAVVERLPLGEIQLVEIAAGGHFAMHTSPDVAFCQIVRGRGKLGLPDGAEIPYEGPELYVFHPGSLHDWHDVEEDTLLSVCLVRVGNPKADSGAPPAPCIGFPESR